MKIRLEGSPDDMGKLVNVLLDNFYNNLEQVRKPVEENEDKWEFQSPENQINVVYLEFDFKNTFEKEQLK